MDTEKTETKRSELEADALNCGLHRDDLETFGAYSRVDIPAVIAAAKNWDPTCGRSVYLYGMPVGLMTSIAHCLLGVAIYDLRCVAKVRGRDLGDHSYQLEHGIEERLQADVLMITDYDANLCDVKRVVSQRSILWQRNLVPGRMIVATGHTSPFAGDDCCDPTNKGCHAALFALLESTWGKPMLIGREGIE